MRGTTLAYSLMLVLGTVVFAPAADAAAYCVTKVKEPVPNDRCDGVACLGYSGYHGWQYCVPPHPCDLIECYCTCPPMDVMERLGVVA